MLAVTGAATIDEVAVYSTTVLAARALDHFNQGSAPWAGDTVAVRAARYLTLVGWPSADQTVAGSTILQAVSLANQDALTALQALEAAEQGQLYIDGSGSVILRNRGWRYSTAAAITSNATFGDSGSEFRYADLVTDGGQQFIFNTIIAQRTGGANQIREDATSQGKYFERTYSVTGLQSSDDADVGYVADWRLATHKDVIQRVTRLQLLPRRDPTNLFPQALGRDIGERVTIKRRPQGVGTALTYTPLVEGIDDTFDANWTWATTWYLSSADSNSAVQPLILDDAVYGLLDTAVLGP